MVSITFVDVAGTERHIEAPIGQSVMAAAVQHNIPDIVADCGGSLACSTCHVYVDEVFLDIVGAPDDDEEDMLDGTAAERLPVSRLSCQLEVTEAMDGLIVRTPAEQR
ncbi:2Fe-2S iron-sulfur cluster binding domain-containing protein [Rhodococcus sp. Eu-32]|uniref:2Fe-2S iron-sulfur cluster-binding protein n=1 Tax=Rhodococcus sp. Eu-32 TaxID=1017319 RepID=UPI000DF44E72|nr:2Fe-2S iron-sulfur cluster-binding protein [Rhodococcus sp. Eu-32]RRQ28982.1 2Fe-2S iron-sulfur cluster binding domain-containing protein [Rhodococcus sp. Eu-32]